MIMVANKRSKSQMTTDLNLFLGSNTGKFAGEIWSDLKINKPSLHRNIRQLAASSTAEASGSHTA